MGNYYSYMRILTDSERQSFARQEKSAKNFTDREQFNKLDKLLQSNDTVVYKDLSRFTREAENGYKNTWSGFKEASISFS